MTRHVALRDNGSSTSDVPHEARFTTEQYYRIADSGALDGFAKTELHDGRIVVANARHVPHARIKTEIGFDLRDSLRAGGHDLSVVIEVDVEIADGAVLQPDILVWKAADLDKGVPANRVRLVVEVAGKSEASDLHYKPGRYAAAGIPEYWVIILRTSRIERFAEPRNGAYCRRDSFTFDEGCAALTLPGVALSSGTVRI